MLCVSPEKVIEKTPAKLICESCGAEFFCGAKIGECWCFAVEVKAETLLDLREKFSSCLCEDCLPILRRTLDQTSR